MKSSLLNLFSSLSILLLVAVNQSSAQTPQSDDRPRTASISGRVTLGGQAAANVTVKIVESDSRAGSEFFSTSRATAMSEPRTFNLITDAEGRYRLAGLAAGTYKVNATSKAYVLSNQNSDIEPVKWITLDGGEAREDVDLSLARGGVITGRVTSSDGRPLIATRVWLFDLLRQGDRTEYRLRADQYDQMFETDDRGVYRIYGLPAGRYILSAGGAESYSSSKDPASNYRRTYFRDATSGNKATIIEVKEGSEIIDVDILVGAQKKIYEASGRLVEAETGKPIPNAQVWAYGYEKGEEEEGRPRDTSSDIRSTVAGTDSQGNFRLTDLTPGRYEVSYSGSGRDSERYSDPTVFEIVDDSIESLEVKVRRAATISGVAVIEGPVDPNLRTLLFTPDSINVDIVVVQQHGRSTSRLPITRIEPNGQFRIHITERRDKEWKVYFVANQMKVKGLRVLRVEHNGVEAPDGIEANQGQQITGVRVSFTQASGAVRGQVKFIGALPENAETLVVITPATVESASSRDGRSTSVNVDGKGRFVFDALLPGEYEVTARLMMRIGRNHTTNIQGLSLPVQRITVTNGQETPVELTIDLSKTGQEKRL